MSTHDRRNSGTACADDEGSAGPTQTPAIHAPYVPLGGSAPNNDGKICRCGSTTHLTSAHKRCPLNARWEGSADHPVRLGLFEGRKLYRWYDCSDGGVRKYPGQVVSVENGLFTIKYEVCMCIWSC